MSGTVKLSELIGEKDRRIKELEAEREQLREALQPFTELKSSWAITQDMIDKAKQALKGG